MNRRDFLLNIGRLGCGVVLGGVAYRILGSHIGSEEKGPDSRYVWAINTSKCTACGKCESACVRTPSAVKAVNDQKKCSNCVVCYGHITNKEIESDKIMSDGIRVCKHDAIIRSDFPGDDTSFVYSIDETKCTGCGDCVEICNTKGTNSMFLVLRPDLCLFCNSCNIAEKCPEQAVERVYIGVEDDIRFHDENY